MRRVSWNKAVNPQTLYASIIAAIPALAPVVVAGLPQAQVLIETDAASVTLSVPDGTDLTALDAVVSRHIFTPIAPVVSARDTARAALQAATNIGDIKAALVAYLGAS